MRVSGWIVTRAQVECLRQIQKGDKYPGGAGIRQALESREWLAWGKNGSRWELTPKGAKALAEIDRINGDCSGEQGKV